MTNERNWFAPKIFGYGSGLPIAWQGWALLGGYLLVLAAAAPLIAFSPGGYGAIATLATAVLLIVCARKTRGGWRWRWGGETE